MKFTPAAEDYLKIIYKLEQSKDIITTSDIANRMKVSMASTTNMIKRLAKNGFISHEPYKGVRLTPKGEKFILKLVRRHRLLELFLTQALKMDWDKVDAEAERLEHVISDELEHKIDEYLDYPDTDPHGDPIPRLDGTIAKPIRDNLNELEAGYRGIIRQVSDANPDILCYLGKLGLLPNTQIEIIRREPFDGGLVIKAAEKEHYIGQQVARVVYVEQIKDK